MDPNATIAQIIADGITRELADAYNDWLEFGGFAARVQTHPATDDWMKGDRYGMVTHVGHEYLYVSMDRTRKARRFRPSDLLPVD